MPKPSNHRCLGSLLDRDSFGAGNRPAANRRGVVSHDTGEPLSKIGVVRVRKDNKSPEKLVFHQKHASLPVRGVGCGSGRRGDIKLSSALNKYCEGINACVFELLKTRT